MSGSFGADAAAAIAGADAVCGDAAASQSLGGSWVAWLTNDARSNMSAPLASGGPWYLLKPDGSPDTTQLVATGYSDLTDGTLAHGITVDEAGAVISSQYRVWTGTNIGGDHDDKDCSNWTVGLSAVLGQYGLCSPADSTWTNYQSQVCGQQGRSIASSCPDAPSVWQRTVTTFPLACLPPNECVELDGSPPQVECRKPQ